MSISSFADDTHLLHGIKSCQDQIALQADLLKVVEWSNKNNMKLNEKKYELLCHGTNEALKSVEYISNINCATTQPIQSSTEVKNLGIIISEDLLWDKQISEMGEKAKKMLHGTKCFF